MKYVVNIVKLDKNGKINQRVSTVRELDDKVKAIRTGHAVAGNSTLDPASYAVAVYSEAQGKAKRVALIGLQKREVITLDLAAAVTYRYNGKTFALDTDGRIWVARETESGDIAWRRVRTVPDAQEFVDQIHMGKGGRELYQIFTPAAA